jgi:hypothetical protein
VRAVASKVVVDSASRTADTSMVVVEGPTLVAFYPATTQAQVDSSEDLATVFDDFSYHLSSAADSLRALGITLREREVGTIQLVESGRRRHFILPKDSADFGYLFLAPRRAQRAYYGVMTNSDLVAAAHEYLAPGP